jgi:hypothetical protein
MTSQVHVRISGRAQLGGTHGPRCPTSPACAVSALSRPAAQRLGRTRPRGAPAAFRVARVTRSAFVQSAALPGACWPCPCARGWLKWGAGRRRREPRRTRRGGAGRLRVHKTATEAPFKAGSGWSPALLAHYAVAACDEVPDTTETQCANAETWGCKAHSLACSGGSRHCSAVHHTDKCLCCARSDCAVQYTHRRVRGAWHVHGT